MSILDTERKFKRPTEEVARVIVGHMDSYGAIGFAAKFPPSPGTGVWPKDYAKVEQAAVRLATRAVLSRLIALGFISELGMEALKAENDGGKTG